MTGAKLNKVREIFNGIVPVPDDEWNRATRFFSFKNFKKNDYLIRTDEVTFHSFVIIEGIVRFFYILEDGKEYNSRFAIENCIVGSFNSMVLKQPSRFSVQALEDTETVVFSRPNIELLYETSFFWQRFGRLAAEFAMIEKEIQEGDALDSLEVRYKKFLQNYPEINNRIPQYHIASHLKVTDVALSRLRKRIKII